MEENKCQDTKEQTARITKSTRMMKNKRHNGDNAIHSYDKEALEESSVGYGFDNENAKSGLIGLHLESGLLNAVAPPMSTSKK